MPFCFLPICPSPTRIQDFSGLEALDFPVPPVLAGFVRQLAASSHENLGHSSAWFGSTLTLLVVFEFRLEKNPWQVETFSLEIKQLIFNKKLLGCQMALMKGTLITFSRRVI